MCRPYTLNLIDLTFLYFTVDPLLSLLDFGSNKYSSSFLLLNMVLLTHGVTFTNHCLVP